jgi:hypothetical protein
VICAITTINLVANSNLFANVITGFFVAILEYRILVGIRGGGLTLSCGYARVSPGACHQKCKSK